MLARPLDNPTGTADHSSAVLMLSKISKISLIVNGYQYIMFIVNVGLTVCADDFFWGPPGRGAGLLAAGVAEGERPACVCCPHPSPAGDDGLHCHTQGIVGGCRCCLRNRRGSHLSTQGVRIVPAVMSLRCGLPLAACTDLRCVVLCYAVLCAGHRRLGQTGRRPALRPPLPGWLQSWQVGASRVLQGCWRLLG